MKFNFTGKTALVTGVAVGIGRATAIMLAKNGAKVAVIDCNAELLEKAKKELETYCDEVMALQCDISDEAKASETVKTIMDTFGRIDILVNNAAIWRCWGDWENISTDEWRKYLDVNVMGTVYITNAVRPKMKENNYGKIINVASVAGVYGNAYMPHYSATKAAVIAMTKALAKQVAQKGICVNAVSPGTVSPAENEDMDYFTENSMPYMGRTGTDNENASLICFLASD